MWKLLSAVLLCYLAWIWVYPPSSAASFSGGQLIPTTVQDSIDQYIETCAPLAIQEMERTHIPASIKLAQALLESRFGSSPLAQQANNHFGIKAPPGWDGRARHCSYSYEWSSRRGSMVPVLSCFRRYKDLAACFTSHSEFLQTRAHYAPLFELSPTDIKGWAEGLQQAGYATDPEYAQKLLSVIKKYQLERFDRVERWFSCIFVLLFMIKTTIMDNKKAQVVKTSDITLRVGLDENNVPLCIDWQAQDSPDTPDFKSCKAMLLSLFDEEYRDTYKIDLWTSELQVAEMNKFMYQTLRGLSDTYFRATKNTDLANDMRKFVQYFGEKTEVAAPEE